MKNAKIVTFVILKDSHSYLFKPYQYQHNKSITYCTAKNINIDIFCHRVPIPTGKVSQFAPKMYLCDILSHILYFSNVVTLRIFFEMVWTSHTFAGSKDSTSDSQQHDFMRHREPRVTKIIFFIFSKSTIFVIVCRTMYFS